MRGRLWKGLAAAALVAFVLVPAASAKRKHAASVRLPLVVLSKPALGAAAKPLALASDSGKLSNVAEEGRTLGGVSPKFFTKLGRVAGYALHYGDEGLGLSGVDSVWTSVDRYKTAAGAKKALAFWRKDDAKITLLNQGSLSVTAAKVWVPRLGAARFASLVSYSAPNIVPVSSLDEMVRDGRYLLDVTVSAGTPAQAERLAPQYAKKLDRRLHLALAGKLHARQAKLPANPKPGPPVGGPDLSQLALGTSDVTGSATLLAAGYDTSPPALSDYSVFLLPAGQFDFLTQDIEWYPTANEAGFSADWANASMLAGGATAVDLGAVGHGAQGAVLHDPANGDLAQAVLSVGRLTDLVFLGGSSTIQDSDLSGIAQDAANKIDAAGVTG